MAGLARRGAAAAALRRLRLLRRRLGAAGFSAAAGASAAAGLASSSAMIRRIDARISSIEGSWTFAGCVISNSTSSTPSPAFYTNRDGIDGSGFASPDFRPPKPDLSPDQVPPATFARSRPRKGSQAPCCPEAEYGTNRSATSGKVWHGNNRLQAKGCGRSPFRSVRKGLTISGRRACARRPSCRAPDGSARSDRRPWSPG